MRAGRAMYSFVTLLALAGCSMLSVNTDYDTSVNFTTWRTYRWASGPSGQPDGGVLAMNPLAYRRIRDAVNRELAAKGYYLRETGQVDFTVAVRATVQERAYFEPSPAFGFGYGYPNYSRGPWSTPWWGDPWWGVSGFGYYNPQIVYYNEGVLIMDVNDASRGALAWTGHVWGPVQRGRTPAEMQARINEAVRKLLEEFPPMKR